MPVITDERFLGHDTGYRRAGSDGPGMEAVRAAAQPAARDDER